MSAYRIAAERFIDPIPGIWKILRENRDGIAIVTAVGFLFIFSLWAVLTGGMIPIHTSSLRTVQMAEKKFIHTCICLCIKNNKCDCNCQLTKVINE